LARKPKPTTLYTWVSEDRGRGLLRGEPFKDRAYSNPEVEGVYLLSEPECYLDSLHQKNLWTLDLPPFCDPLFMPVLQFSGIRLKIC